MKRIQVCSNEGPRPFPRGDNYEIAKIHLRNLKIFFSWIPFTQGCFMPSYYYLLLEQEAHPWATSLTWENSSYDYIITLIKRRKKKLYEKELLLHLKKLESPSPKDALCQVWIKLALCFWRRGFFNFVNVFSLFRNYLLLEKGGPLHLNKLDSPSPRVALCQVWLKFAQWFWRRRFF